jgi:hypothetical protein
MRLLKLRVFRFGFFVDGDVGIGVFPEGEEILLCRFRFGGVAGHGVSATDLQVGQRSGHKVHHDAPGRSVRTGWRAK